MPLAFIPISACYLHLAPFDIEIFRRIFAREWIPRPHRKEEGNVNSVELSSNRVTWKMALLGVPETIGHCYNGLWSFILYENNTDSICYNVTNIRFIRV